MAKFSRATQSFFIASACRYYCLAFRAHQMPEATKGNAAAILERAGLEDWVLGSTKAKMKLTIEK